MTLVAWATVAIFVGVYVLVATERIHRVAAALGGAALVLGLGIVGSEEAFYSPETGIDWDVIFLLLGMMLVVGVIRRTGVFEYLAIRSAKLARGRPYGVLVLLVLVTAAASALLDNVTTVLLVAPVTLLVCDRLGLKPIPFLIAEALASNIGGTATLVGDPPNIIIASRADLTFTDFLVHLAPIVLVILAAFLVLSRFLFRDALTGDPARAAALMSLDEKEAITDRTLLVRSSVVLAAILIGFLLQRQTGVSPSVVALVGAGVLVLLSPVKPRDLLADVEWETLLFFMGLFVLVGALVHVGALELLAEQIGGHHRRRHRAHAHGDARRLGRGVRRRGQHPLRHRHDAGRGVADRSNPALGQDGALWWALALGADLGGNATLIGASANVVIVGIAARNALHISFRGWLRYGIPTAVMSIAISVPYVLLRYA